MKTITRELSTGKSTSMNWRDVYAHQIAEIFNDVLRRVKRNQNIEEIAFKHKAVTEHLAVVSDYKIISYWNGNEEVTLDPWDQNPRQHAANLIGEKERLTKEGKHPHFTYMPRKYTLIQMAYNLAAYNEKNPKDKIDASSPSGVLEAFNRGILK